MNRKYWLLVLLAIMIFPEGCVIASKADKAHNSKNNDIVAHKVPIVYHPHYNITAYGLEKLHPVDGAKYNKVYQSLRSAFGLDAGQFFMPHRVTDAELLAVHSQSYLDSLYNSSVLQSILELPVAWIPNIVLRWLLLEPMRLATGGTVMAAQLALEHGWAINLSGGYHHAKRDNGEGFCVYADIPLAINDLWKNNPALKVMVIDLDAHQGNGHEAILAGDPRVAIVDIYNNDIYPHDVDAQAAIRYNFPVGRGIKTDSYISLLSAELPKALDEFAPDLIIYNAGSDIYAYDPLGGMKVSKQGIIERDQIVFGAAKVRKTPIVMLLSGGYTQESHAIITESISNLASQGLISLTKNS